MPRIRALLLLAGLLSTAAIADTFNVSRFDDSGQGCDAVSCSLRAAVIAANDLGGRDTIILPPGVYTIDRNGNDSSPETGDLDITDDVTIRGGPSIIDGQNDGRIMDIRSDANVTLEQLTLRNGNTSLATNGTLNGGAIIIDGGSLTLRTVTLVDNQAQTLGAGIRAAGGAVIDIENSVFTNNSAGDGAAISSSTGLTIRNSLFDRNRADKSVSGNGGALNLTGNASVTRLEGVTLTGNEGTGTGGAIWFTAKELYIHDSLMVDNVSTGGNGGVITAPGTGHVKRIEIVGSTFDSNVAENGGGISAGDDDDILRIRNSTFVDNQATDNGGGLYVTGGTPRVTNSTFSNNQAVDNGGAVYVSSSILRAEHVTWFGNQADRGDAVFSVGSLPSTMIVIANGIVSGGCEVNVLETLVSEGGNVEGPGDTCEFDEATDVTGQSVAQLGLEPLADNGEPTVCAAVHIDQRYAIRDADCDSGAVEADAIADDLIFADGVEG